MALGYDGKLYILAFDHRGSFTKLFGVSGEPTPEEYQRIVDAKNLIFDGMVIAAEAGEDPSVMGVLVDETYGPDIPAAARKHGLKLAMPVEKSGQDLFDFEYGDAFGEHIESFDPDFTKVLVRYNPESPDPDANAAQLGRLKILSDWLHERDRKFLFELLVPAERHQLDAVGGDVVRYDLELRADLMRRAIAEAQDAGVEADIWKIEGVDDHEGLVHIAEQARSGQSASGESREGVVCVLLGRGADDEQVDKWLYAAAPVEGFSGFAIGRSIWNAPLKAYLAGELERKDAAAKVAENYLRFITVYRQGQ